METKHSTHPNFKNFGNITRNDAIQVLKRHGVSVVVLTFALFASAMATFVTYTYANQSIEDVSNQLSLQVVEGIKNQILAFLNSLTNHPLTLSELIVRKEFDISHSNPTDLKDALRLIYYSFSTSNLTGLFYVDTYGTDVGYLRSGGIPLAFFLFRNITENAHLYLLDENGSFDWTTEEPVSTLPTVTDIIDWAPWAAAREEGHEVWSEPFLIAGVDNIIYAHVRPLYYPDKTLCCGLGLNIAIGVWEDIVSSYKIGKNGKVFVADASTGVLLADSNPGHAKIPTDGDVTIAQLPKATNNDDKKLAAAARRIESMYGWKETKSNAFFKFEYEGEKQLVLLSPLNANTLNLLVVVVVPENDFFGDINDGRRLAVVITVVAAILGAIKYIPFMALYWLLKKKLTQKKVTTKVVEIGPEERL